MASSSAPASKIADSSVSSVTETNSSATREEAPADCRGDEEPNNPTRDILADGLVGLLRPSIETLDKSVAGTRAAQNELRQRIEKLESQLEDIAVRSQAPVDLQTYINKLNSSKKKILVVNSILQGSQDRLNKVHHNCLKETEKRRSLLEN